MLNKVIESTKYVTDNANYVSINYDKIDNFCGSFKEKEIESWMNLAPIDLGVFNDNEKALFLLLVDAINFCFWQEPKWQYNGLQGSLAMLNALYDYVSKNKNLLNSHTLKELTIDDLKRIFIVDQNKQTIPLLEERVINFNNVGISLNKMEEDYGKSFLTIINHMVREEELFYLIHNYFKAYNEDTTMYKGREIYFYKRLQLLISDINKVIYNGKKFSLNSLTIFADYKIPQLMRELELISYNRGLDVFVDSKLELKRGSEAETEIRASIIQAGHYMASKLPDVNEAYIDAYMFSYIKTHKMMCKPHHRVVTTNY